MTAATGARRRWPLLAIGASAGTATWTGWVGLGQLTGFGPVRPLPGILDSLTVNTAVTLPIGVEAYAVYALSIATSHRPLADRTRRYAWASSAAALLLGMGGQVAYHLMNAHHPNPTGPPDRADGVSTSAPWWVTALVSCLPVLVLGAASLLWHLAGQPAPDSVDPDEADQEHTASENTATVSVPGVHVPARSVPGVPVSGVPDPGAPVLGGPVASTPTERVSSTGPEHTDRESAPPTAPVPVATEPEPDARDGDDVAGSADPRDDGRSRAACPSAPPVDGGSSPPVADEPIVAAIVAAGLLPSVRAIKTGHRLGTTRAVRIRAAAQAALQTARQKPLSADQDGWSRNPYLIDGPPEPQRQKPIRALHEPSAELAEGAPKPLFTEAVSGASRNAEASTELITEGMQNQGQEQTKPMQLS